MLREAALGPDSRTPHGCGVRTAARSQLPGSDAWLSSHSGCQVCCPSTASTALLRHPFPNVLARAKRQSLADILRQGKACLEDQRIQP